MLSALVIARRTLAALLLMTRLTAFFVGGIVGRRGGGVIKALRFFPHEAAADEAFKRAEFAMILVRHETDGVTDLIRAAGAADAMDVILDVHRKIIVHYVRNAVHVNAARRDVRGHEHAHGTGFEIVQCAQTLVLRAVGMKRGRLDARRFQLAREPVGGVFHPRKNQHHVHVGFFQQMNEQRRFQMPRHFIDELRDGLGGIRAATDLDNFRRVLKFVRERFDLFRERGGEHQRLPLFRKLADNLPDGRKKTHVQHAVGFVEDEKLEAGEIAVAPAEQIEQASRTRNHNVSCGTQRANLRLFADATEYGGDGEWKMFGVGADVFLDLHDEFARGREDEDTGAAVRPGGSLRGGELCKHRQRERGGLAGAGLRDADEVVTGDDRRNGGGLDGRRFGVTRFLDGL